MAAATRSSHGIRNATTRAWRRPITIRKNPTRDRKTRPVAVSKATTPATAPPHCGNQDRRQRQECSRTGPGAERTRQRFPHRRRRPTGEKRQQQRKRTGGEERRESGRRAESQRCRPDRSIGTDEGYEGDVACQTRDQEADNDCDEAGTHSTAHRQRIHGCAPFSGISTTVGLGAGRRSTLLLAMDIYRTGV